MLLVVAGCGGSQPSSSQASCPNNGTVRMAVEPFEDTAVMTPVYQELASKLGQRLGCNVDLTITTTYTAEVEAMRAKKLELGEFGPLGYVLAHKLANAQPLVTFGDAQHKKLVYYAGIATWPGSGVTDLQQVKGKTFAYSDPASTSGHLFPAYALTKAGIDPDHGIQATYAGTHTASFETLRNHKVAAGELNSQTITSATKTGEYKASDFTMLWRSDPILQDPIAVRGDLPSAFQAKLKRVLLGLDLSSVSDPKAVLGGATLVAASDSDYKNVRDLVGVLNIDLSKLG
jgi:phosphonate transport system substrate-binding protein